MLAHHPSPVTVLGFPEVDEGTGRVVEKSGSPTAPKLLTRTNADGLQQAVFYYSTPAMVRSTLADPEAPDNGWPSEEAWRNPDFSIAFFFMCQRAHEAAEQLDQPPLSSRASYASDNCDLCPSLAASTSNNSCSSIVSDSGRHRQGGRATNRCKADSPGSLPDALGALHASRLHLPTSHLQVWPPSNACPDSEPQAEQRQAAPYWARMEAAFDAMWFGRC